MPARRSHVKGCVVHGASFCPCRMVADGGRVGCDGVTTNCQRISRVLTLEARELGKSVASESSSTRRTRSTSLLIEYPRVRKSAEYHRHASLIGRVVAHASLNKVALFGWP